MGNKIAYVTFKLRVNEEKFKENNPDSSSDIKSLIIEFIEEIETLGKSENNPNHFEEQGYEIMCENYTIK